MPGRHDGPGHDPEHCLENAADCLRRAMQADPEETERCACALGRIACLQGDAGAEHSCRLDADAARARLMVLRAELDDITEHDQFTEHDLSAYALRRLSDALQPLLRNGYRLWLLKKVPRVHARHAHYVLAVLAADGPAQRLVNRLSGQDDRTRRRAMRMAQEIAPDLPLPHVWVFLAPGDALLARTARAFSPLSAAPAR